MRNYKKVHLIGLIGLRALAEYDLSEYNRVTSFSKRELDNKIQSYMAEIDDKETNMLYEDLINSANISENTNELQFLMKQINYTCIQKSQHLALQLTRINPKEKSEIVTYREKESYSYNTKIQSSHDELTRLATMLLLKNLRDYDVKFDYKIKNFELDALLVPKTDALPHIIIETKYSTVPASIDKAINNLKTSMNFWGKNSIGIVLTPKPVTIPEKPSISPKIYFLVFDLENNLFEPRSEKNFFDSFTQQIQK